MVRFDDGPDFIGVAHLVQSPITELMSKIGGTPVGLPEAMWPTCRECGRHMDFIAQWSLKQPVPLSAKYDFAYAFFCHGYLDHHEGCQCNTWYPHTGANRLVLVSNPNPADRPPHLGVQRWPEFELRFERSTPARRVRSEPEPMTEEDAPKILDWVRRMANLYRPGVLPTKAQDGLGLGGSPEWVQSDETPVCPICNGPTKLVGEMPSELIQHRDSLEFPNGVHLPFGGFGTAYAFLCQRECSPESTYLMWQCS